MIKTKDWTLELPCEISGARMVREFDVRAEFDVNPPEPEYDARYQCYMDQDISLISVSIIGGIVDGTWDFSLLATCELAKIPEDEKEKLIAAFLDTDNELVRMVLEEDR